MKGSKLARVTVLCIVVCALSLCKRLLAPANVWLLCIAGGVLLLSAAALPLLVTRILPGVMRAASNDVIDMGYNTMASIGLCGQGLGVIMYAVLIQAGIKNNA